MAFSREHSPCLPDRDRMLAAGVVEGGKALDAEVHLASYDPYVTEQPVTLVGMRKYGHEIKGLGQALRRKVAGQEHVGVGQIQLLAAGILHGPQREVPALPVIQDGAEDARGVEGRQAQPIYRAVLTDERRRIQIPDDTVVFDGQITHAGYRLQSSAFR